MDLSDMPNIVEGQLQPLDAAGLAAPDDPGHAPRILLLYGSNRRRYPITTKRCAARHYCTAII